MSDEAARVFELLAFIAREGLTGDLTIKVTPTVIRDGKDGLWRGVRFTNDVGSQTIGYVRAPD